MALKSDFEHSSDIHSPFVDEIANVSQRKAKIILTEGMIRGQALTRKQRGFFGARAGGAPERKAK